MRNYICGGIFFQFGVQHVKVPVALVFLRELRTSNRNLYCQKFNLKIKFFAIK
jgi:hypothetical protein